MRCKIYSYFSSVICKNFQSCKPTYIWGHRKVARHKPLFPPIFFLNTKNVYFLIFFRVAWPKVTLMYEPVKNVQMRWFKLMTVRIAAVCPFLVFLLPNVGLLLQHFQLIFVLLLCWSWAQRYTVFNWRKKCWGGRIIFGGRKELFHNSEVVRTVLVLLECSILQSSIRF